jgi:hypothetical protein
MSKSSAHSPVAQALSRRSPFRACPAVPHGQGDAPHAALPAWRIRIDDAAFEEAKAWATSTGNRQAVEYALKKAAWTPSKPGSSPQL